MIPLSTLNRRLGEALGFVLGLSQPKFQWKATQDCEYFFKGPTALFPEKLTWADRLGAGYVLTIWRLPTVFDAASKNLRVLTEEEWKQMFGGMIPYPSRGCYQAYPESFTLEVTAEANQNYIRALDLQMQTTLDDQMDRVNLKEALDRAKWWDEFYDKTFDMAPAFGQWKSGSRDGHVSLPAVAGQR
jgi:hypothetical protein